MKLSVDLTSRLSARHFLEKELANLKKTQGDHAHEALLIWSSLPALVVGGSDTRLPQFDWAQAQLNQLGIEVVRRPSGGTAVPQGPGVVNVSRIFSPPTPRNIEQLYQEFCRLLASGFKAIGLETSLGEVVLDFKSLYPSIIRTFCIDPMGLALGLAAPEADSSLIVGFQGGRFSRERHLLPDIIRQLWGRRDEAKARGDSAQSQAIKIIMNSFYGVLGTPGCRFFDARLASSITRRGHQIIQQTRECIEALGERVIYGDTDSVFVWLQDVGSADAARERGRYLERELNQWWVQRLEQEFELESLLELEFETHYQRFLMPTVRGSDKGSKKRYAGVIISDGKPELVFKGLENVRTDWTQLARRFQSELYRRVFFDEPYVDYIKQIVVQLMAGELDAELVYRKRLRRKLDDYQRNVPPHVQAARIARERGEPATARGDWVEYVISLHGAEPAASAEAGLDYQHYLERQLAPVADGILHFLDTSFAAITDQQYSLF